VERAGKPETRARHSLRLFLAETLQRRLLNGFVVFQPQYPRGVEQLIRMRVAENESRDIGWEETLTILRGMMDSK